MRASFILALIASLNFNLHAHCHITCMQTLKMHLYICMTLISIINNYREATSFKNTADIFMLTHRFYFFKKFKSKFC